MIAVFNNASFEEWFKTIYEANEAFKKLLNITKELKKEYITNRIQYKGEKISLSRQIGKNITLYDVLNGWDSESPKGKEERRLMITLLSRIETGLDAPKPGREISIKGVSFLVPMDTSDTMLISLSSNEYFRVYELQALQKDNKIINLPNISEMDHIWEHRKLLGIRKYESNPKHKEKPYSYGKGKESSPMISDDKKAQWLLNRAVLIDGRLYTVYNNECFVFMNHIDVYYHGHIVNNPSDKIKKVLKIK